MDTHDTSSGARPSSADRPLILVLHGAQGDLASRLVLPGLAELAVRGLLPERWALVGTGMTEMSDDDFSGLVRRSIEQFGPKDTADAATATEALTEHLSFVRNVSTDATTTDLTARVADLRDRLTDGAGKGGAGADAGEGTDVQLIHYLAIPPLAVTDLIQALDRQGLTKDSRVVFEKPYGTSLESFHTLDALVHSILDEDQVYRIDHFLGKEATQNLHVLRFANELFGPAWSREHIQQVQIDVPETLDVANRAKFYDATGAGLDMIVTHLFQVAAEVAMEPPAGLDEAHVSSNREAAIACFRPLDPVNDVVLGQFEGYRDIDDVAPGSTTDTYVAARLWIDNDRWRGVPFLLRTGKRLATSAQRVTLVLRAPDDLYGHTVGPNNVSVSLAGDGEIVVTTTVKRPGPDLALGTGSAVLSLDDVSPGEPLSPYASLLHDLIIGDRSLFTTSAGLESAWKAFAPLQGPDRPAPLPYAQGTWGPKEADALAEPFGWRLEPMQARRASQAKGKPTS